MHPRVSNAEIEVLKALSAAGLTEGLVTQKTIVLKSATPDFCWLGKRKAVYLDGSVVHSSDKQQERDREACELLSAKGWEVLRIQYDAPLTREALDKIILTIKQFLGEDSAQADTASRG
jgi:very-short-patch-repair endonuclease